MPDQTVRIVGRYFLLHPEQKAEIDDLREQGLPDEAAAILTVVAEKLSIFEAIDLGDGDPLFLNGGRYGAGDCYKAALEMARELVGE